MSISQYKGLDSYMKSDQQQTEGREPEVDNFDNCSYNTQSLLQMYWIYIDKEKWDDRVERLYPLLDEVESWMHKQYGDDIELKNPQLGLDQVL